MIWVVQNNLGSLDDVESIRKACEGYGSDISKIVRDVYVYVENHYEKEKMNFG